MAGYGIWYGVAISWPVVGGCPASELRQHLSERVPPAASPMFTFMSMLITNDAVKGVLYHENVLTCPKSSNYDVLFQENVLDGTKFMFSLDKTWMRQELGLVRSGASQFAS